MDATTHAAPREPARARARGASVPVRVLQLPHHLAGVAAVEQQVQRLGAALEALDDVLGGFDLAFPEPSGDLRLGGREAVEVVEDDEALHPPSPDQQVDVVARACRWPVAVVGGDRSAQDDAAFQRELAEAVVEDRAADVVEVQVDAVGAALAQTCREVVVLVVARLVEAQLLDYVGALLPPPRPAPHPPPAPSPPHLPA